MITENYVKALVRHYPPPFHEDVFSAVAGVFEDEWFLDIKNPATDATVRFFGSDAEDLVAIFHQFDQMRARLGIVKE